MGNINWCQTNICSITNLIEVQINIVQVFVQGTIRRHWISLPHLFEYDQYDSSYNNVNNFGPDAMNDMEWHTDHAITLQSKTNVPVDEMIVLLISMAIY